MFGQEARLDVSKISNQNNRVKGKNTTLIQYTV